jgi:hypothetical protein
MGFVDTTTEGRKKERSIILSKKRNSMNLVQLLHQFQ